MQELNIYSLEMSVHHRVGRISFNIWCCCL